MRKFISLTLGSIILCSLFTLPAFANDYPPYEEETVIERLKAVENPLVEHRYNSIVKGYIKNYVLWNRPKAERILGRTVLYFPIIEDYLNRQGMPEKLKYLPVVESALVPHAVSPVGAVGLWQFMPETGKEYGLKIDDKVDERKDPHKATKAALAYLSKQYEKYGDWALALAAYNGGSGRVSRAIKRGRSKDFWRIRRYLPRETRNYVPAFIGATYLMEYYKEHEIEPQYPALDYQITEAVQVYNYFSFYRIAQITGLPLEVIEMLNPAYKRGIVPSDVRGNFVILPKRVMPAFKDYLKAQRPDHLADYFFDDSPVEAEKTLRNSNEQYVKRTYTVGKGETINQIAKKLNCAAHQVITWNKLESTELFEGQKLVVYQPRSFKRFQPLEKMAPLPGIAPVPLQRARVEHQVPPPAPQRNYLYYSIREKENLESLSQRIPGMPLPALIELNLIPPNEKLQPGTCIKVPRLR